MSTPASALPPLESKDSEFIAEGHYEMRLGGEAGVPVRVGLEIDRRSYAGTLLFSHLRTPYQFNLTTWTGRRFKCFLDLFFGVGTPPRDPTVFGAMGIEEGYEGARAQRLACVERGMLDVMECLSKIVQTHSQNTLSYALWYCEHWLSQSRGEGMTYSRFITMVTCQCVVATSFLASREGFSVVEF